ncbi:hypothetical protein VFPPC_17913 [Pochonia chlamydosporia 170]|uniref:Uncharacterized protein n=1 Tax=Pochonia chlamydosporia 170 TaxID=1380566 RepID=A0A219ARD7_METCM|nr:hypothetical protein VFPPC_17913 [Pochonia chlamydosporia 170]OWT42894.1 hypothetical protein VFPPC_17913 [Pochonia chlamydosporia 170]
MRAFQSRRDQHDGPVRRTVYKNTKYLHNTSQSRSYWTWGLLAYGLRGCEGRGVNKFPSSRARVPWTTTPSFLPRILLEKHGLLQLCISSFNLQYLLSSLFDLLCNYNIERTKPDYVEKSCCSTNDFCTAPSARQAGRQTERQTRTAFQLIFLHILQLALCNQSFFASRRFFCDRRIVSSSLCFDPSQSQISCRTRATPR